MTAKRVTKEQQRKKMLKDIGLFDARTRTVAKSKEGKKKLEEDKMDRTTKKRKTSVK